MISGPEEIQGRDAFEVLLVRDGCFRFRDARGDTLVDSTTCVLGSPRQLAEMSHPAPGGDVYTQIALSVDAWHSLTGGEQVPLAARVSTRMLVAARGMVAAARLGIDPMGPEEAALNLVAAAVAQAEPIRIAAGRPKTARSRRRLAEEARTIMVGNPAVASIREVAADLHCSPHHLSRVFRAHTGMTVAGYRTQLRLNLALELLADGGVSIADTAVRCGFADQAHLTRALRRHAGSTPQQLRQAMRSPLRGP